MYQTEQKFSIALCKLLSDNNIFHQRIESGETGRGIPDIYIRTKTKEYWVELKNSKRSSIYNKQWTIPWRKGQQAWATKYKQMTGHMTFTLCAMNDGYIWLNMYKHFSKNIVPCESVTYRFTRLNDLIKGGILK
jgi:hypothetical protein